MNKTTLLLALSMLCAACTSTPTATPNDDAATAPRLRLATYNT